MTEPYDVNSIWQAIERVARAAGSYEPGEEEAVTWLQDQLGLSRPLASYAPRSRRRYKAASRKGITAREQNKREYRRNLERKTKKTSNTGTLGTASKRLIANLIKERNTILPHSRVDMDDVNDYILGFGADTVIDMLQSQIRATYFWIESDHMPGSRQLGNGPWNDRRFTSRPKPDFSDYISNTDIMYYYHGRRG
jgi:hypothetical protein